MTTLVLVLRHLIEEWSITRHQKEVARFFSGCSLAPRDSSDLIILVFFSLASVSRNVFLSRCSLPPSSNNKQKPFHLMELPGNAAIQDVSVFLSVET